MSFRFHLNYFRHPKLQCTIYYIIFHVVRTKTSLSTVLWRFPVNSLSVLKRPYPHLKFHKHMLDTRCNNPQYTVIMVVIKSFRTLNYQITQQISTTFNKYMKCISSKHSINYTCSTKISDFISSFSHFTHLNTYPEHILS